MKGPFLMPEPHVSTAGITLGASVGITGTIVGAQADALVVGLVSAAFISIWLRHIDSWVKATAATFFSAMLAAFLSPFAADWAARTFGLASGDALRMLMTLLISAGCPAIFPRVLKLAVRQVPAGKES